MKRFALLGFIVFYLTTASFSQNYKDTVRLYLKWSQCRNPDSIANELEKIKYDENYIVKDLYITRKIDSLIFKMNAYVTIEELKKYLGPKIKVELASEDSLCIFVWGGYILFSINFSPYKNDCFIMYNPKKGLSGYFTKRQKRKNKMRVECPLIAESEVDYFFNCHYFLKYIQSQAKLVRIKYGSDYGFTQKENIYIPERFKIRAEEKRSRTRY